MPKTMLSGALSSATSLYVFLAMGSGFSQTAAPVYTIIHEFTGAPTVLQAPDGSGPWGVTLGPDGVLYGATWMGGTYQYQFGSVYSLAPPAAPGGAWTETILHAFTGAPNDGDSPESPVIIGSGGRIFGTTQYGGSSRLPEGVIYELTPGAHDQWSETILQDFGVYLSGSLAMGQDGVLYGVTTYGGSGPCYNGRILPPGCGTVFALTPPASPGHAATRKILYNFQGPTTGDGDDPVAGVVIGSDARGHTVLYGTTFYGGDSNNGGTAFSLTAPSSSGDPWTETVLCSFPGISYEGLTYTAYPVITAITPQGALLGTTAQSGQGACQNDPPGGPCGTVFALTPSAPPGGAWTQTVLHNFTGSPDDGFAPLSGVVVGPDGTLYGTTEDGGSGPCETGCGVVYALKPPSSPGGAWTETILHDFMETDGFRPDSGVILGAGPILYGTTVLGGNTNCDDGCGVVFSIQP
jgi:hypothetical protein